MHYRGDDLLLVVCILARTAVAGNSQVTLQQRGCTTAKERKGQPCLIQEAWARVVSQWKPIVHSGWDVGRLNISLSRTLPPKMGFLRAASASFGKVRGKVRLPDEYRDGILR